jgi:hypothetical protein
MTTTLYAIHFTLCYAVPDLRFGSIIAQGLFLLNTGQKTLDVC